MTTESYRCALCGHVQSTAPTPHARRVALQHHVKIHLGYRRFGCPYCDVTCVMRSEVKEHVGKQHPGEVMHVLDKKVSSFGGGDGGGVFIISIDPVVFCFTLVEARDIYI